MRSGAGPRTHTEAGAKEGSDRLVRGCKCSGEGCQGQEAVWVECQPGRGACRAAARHTGETRDDSGWNRSKGSQALASGGGTPSAKVLGALFPSLRFQGGGLTPQHLSRWGERKGSGAQATWCARGPGSSPRTGGTWAAGMRRERASRTPWMGRPGQGPLEKGEEDVEDGPRRNTVCAFPRGTGLLRKGPGNGRGACSLRAGLPRGCWLRSESSRGGGVPGKERPSTRGSALKRPTLAFVG